VTGPEAPKAGGDSGNGSGSGSGSGRGSGSGERGAGAGAEGETARAQGAQGGEGGGGRKRELLYDLVRGHLGAFLDHARETYGKPLPRYVERAFRDYLSCGVFAHGFLRFHCDKCGEDLLVAFSCKGRGVCPSCGQRRMCNTAAHLVDRVLPSVPVRQWVLSLPLELRPLPRHRAGRRIHARRGRHSALSRHQHTASGFVGAHRPPRT